MRSSRQRRAGAAPGRPAQRHPDYRLSASIQVTAIQLAICRPTRLAVPGRAAASGRDGCATGGGQSSTCRHAQRPGSRALREIREGKLLCLIASGARPVRR